MSYNEIYFRDPTDPKYRKNVLESDSKLENLITKIKMILYTRKGEVLGQPELGMNLDDYLFETKYNELQIRDDFYTQLAKFVPESSEFKIDYDVGIKSEGYHNMLVLNIKIDDVKILDIEV
jgi:phage baseplate assembly protein W